MNIERIQKCHYQAARYPKIYRLHVRLTAYFGTLILWLIVALYLSFSLMALGLIIVQPIVAILIACWAVPAFCRLLNCLITMPEYDPPRGFYAEKSLYPTLYAQMNDIAQKINQKPAYRIHFSDEVDASLYYQPRLLGWFGMRNTLILGVPLIASLNQEQLRSVIARQLAFAPYNHLYVTIDKHRVRWQWVQEYFEENHHLFRFMMSRFIAYFDDIIHPILHQNSFATERVAAAATSVNAIAQARGNIQLAGNYEREYWQKIWQQTDQISQPEPMPFKNLIKELSRLPEYCPDLPQRLNQLMQMRSTVDNHIPALRDAYEELGVYSRLKWVTADDSALTWLDGRLPNLIKLMDTHWWENASENWQEAYDKAKTEQNRLIELQNKTETLSLEESMEQALLTERYQGMAAALPLFDALYQREKSAKHAFHYGRALLAENDADGILYLRQCRDNQQDQSFIAASWLVEAEYHRQHERHPAADYCEQEFAKQREQEEWDEYQRSHIEADDMFQAATLSPTESQAWQQRFSQIKNLKRVYWVEKANLAMPNKPLFVIVFVVSFTLFPSERNEVIERVREQILQILSDSNEWRGDWILAAHRNLPNRAWHRIQQVPNGLLYQKKKRRDFSGS